LHWFEEDKILKHALFHKISIKSTYIKLILSYFFIAVFITAILSLTLYDSFQNTSLKVIQSDSKSRLSQNINNLTLIRSHIFSLGQQLSLDNSILLPVFGNEKLSPHDEAVIYTRLKNTMYSDSIIHSIFLYNGKTHQILHTFDVEKEECFTESMLSLLSTYNEYDKFQFVPAKISYRKLNGDIKSESIITAVFPMSEYSGNSTNPDQNYPTLSAILINLDADTLHKNIASTSPDQVSSTTIIDSNGNVIFDSNMVDFVGNLSNQEYIQNILMSSEIEDAIIKNINGEKSMIVYRKMDFPEWIFINIYAFKDLFKEIDRLGTIILFICIGILLAAAGYSFITAKTIYSPFKHLLSIVKGWHAPQTVKGIENNIDKTSDVQYLSNTFNSILKRTRELESSVNDSLPYVKKELLKKLIMGQHIPESKMSKRFDTMFKNMIQENGSFSVIVFSIDEYNSNAKKEKSENEEILLYSMEIFITRALSEYFSCEPIDYENNDFYILIKLEDDGYISSQSLAILKTIHESIQSSTKHKISCAIGMPVNSIEDINISYSNAVDIIRYRLVYGCGSFLSYDMQELAFKESFVSIDKEKERLLQGIKMCKLEEAETGINNIINSISQCQYDYIMFTMNQLMLDIVKSARIYFESDSIEIDFNNIYGNLNRIKTLYEMRDFFKLYCKSVIEKIEKKRSNRTNDMIQDTISYISSHYHEYDISTELLANMANLTPGYFGKLFAEYTGKTVNEHIMSLRFSKAKELLTTTSLTINDISEKVGFTNPTYFITLFKKSFGIPPNQFRSENISRV
jgi:two-component system response regulator YesN